MIERFLEKVKELVRVAFVEGQGRSETDGLVATAAEKQAVLHRVANDFVAFNYLLILSWFFLFFRC